MNRIALLSGLFLTGCASHISRGTLPMAERVTQGIPELCQSKKKLIRRFGKESRDRIHERIYFIWGPKQIKNYLAKSKFTKEVCKAEGLDRAVAMLDKTIWIHEKLAKKKAILYKAVRASERQMLTETDEFCDPLVSYARGVENNIRAVQKSQKYEEGLIEKAKKHLPNLDRIDEEREKLDKLMENL